MSNESKQMTRETKDDEVARIIEAANKVACLMGLRFVLDPEKVAAFNPREGDYAERDRHPPVELRSTNDPNLGKPHGADDVS